MSRSIEVYSSVIVIAFIIEVIAVIIHGTPLALLAYAVTIVMVFLIIAIAMNLRIREPMNNEEAIETEEDMNTRRTYLEDALLTMVIDEDILMRSFPTDDDESNNAELEILEIQNNINENNKTIDVLPDPDITENYSNNNDRAESNSGTIPEVLRDIESSPLPQPLKLDSKICSVCLSDYKIDEAIVYSDNEECNHCFHKECLILWFMKKHVSCPNCRCEFIHIIKEDIHNNNNDLLVRNSHSLDIAS